MARSFPASRMYITIICVLFLVLPPWLFLLRINIHCEYIGRQIKESDIPRPFVAGMQYRSNERLKWSLADIINKKVQEVIKGLWEGLSEEELLQHGFEVTENQPFQPLTDHSGSWPADAWLDPSTHGNMTFSQIETHFDRLCQMTHLKCLKEVRMGHEGDGGWNVCISDIYRPKPNGLVYSFGIAHDFSFDDMMADTFGTTVHSFDPSVGIASHLRSKNVHFHDIGLGGIDEMDSRRSKRWKMLTLGGAMKYLGHENATLDMLKIDIEYGEYEVLQQALPTGILRNVKQLAFELHMWHFPTMGLGMFRTAYSLLLELERQGFRRFHSHINPLEPFTNIRTGRRSKGCCFELYYVNLKFLTPTRDPFINIA